MNLIAELAAHFHSSEEDMYRILQHYAGGQFAMAMGRDSVEFENFTTGVLERRPSWQMLLVCGPINDPAWSRLQYVVPAEEHIPRPASRSWAEPGGIITMIDFPHLRPPEWPPAAYWKCDEQTEVAVRDLMGTGPYGRKRVLSI